VNTISHWVTRRNLLEDPGHTVVTRVFQASSRAYNRVTALTTRRPATLCVTRVLTHRSRQGAAMLSHA
jgi:hypothetical protein